MPKKLEYPNNCSLKEAITMAELVKKAGGKANQGFIAEGLGVKEGTGAFRSKIASSLKYGLIERRGSEIHLTKIGDEYFYPLPGKTKEEALIKAFKKVPIFNQILDKCAGQEIDKKILEAMLVHTFEVNRNEASKVAGYFLKSRELIPILEKKGDKFKVPDLSYTDNPSEDTEVEGGNSLLGSSPIKKKLGLDENIFELLLNMGKLLYDETSDKTEISKKIKDSIQNDKENLSHSELFVDLLDSENKKIIEKLRDAIKKDLNIQEKGASENKGECENGQSPPEEVERL